MADTLPTHCIACGAVLMGGRTRHAPDCGIWLAMERVAPGCMPPTQERALVCAMNAPGYLHCAGSVFGIFCLRCGAEVGVSVSGQAALSKDPSLRVMCIDCARAASSHGKITGLEVVDGAVDEIAREVSNRRRKATKARLN